MYSLLLPISLQFIQILLWTVATNEAGMWELWQVLCEVSQHLSDLYGKLTCWSDDHCTNL